MNCPVLVILLFAHGAMLLLLLVVFRARHLGHSEALAQAAAVLGPLYGQDSQIVTYLNTLPYSIAISQVRRLLPQPVSPGHSSTLASLLRPTTHVQRAINQRNSRFWWRRLAAARVLALVAQDGDASMLKELLEDSHPGVQIASASALERLATPTLVEAILDTLPRHSALVQGYEFALLRSTYALTVGELRARLPVQASVPVLLANLRLARLVAAPGTMRLIIPHTRHRDPEVRLAALKALRGDLSAEVQRIFARGLSDADWRVRAQCAKGLGEMVTDTFVPALSLSLGDEQWWVRYRSAIALARSGSSGRAALGTASRSPDPYAADMAQYVLGLSVGAIEEMVD